MTCLALPAPPNNRAQLSSSDPGGDGRSDSGWMYGEDSNGKGSWTRIEENPKINNRITLRKPANFMPPYEGIDVIRGSEESCENLYNECVARWVSQII